MKKIICILAFLALPIPAYALDGCGWDIGSSSSTFSTSTLTTTGTTDLTTGTNQDLTVTPNGSGDLILSTDSGTSVIVSGAGAPDITTATNEDLVINPNGTGTVQLNGANAAGGSKTNLTINPTLGIMDGSDTWYGLSIAPTNADHTGSTNVVGAINIANITGDAQASEYGIILGTGYDRSIYSAGALNIASDASTVLWFGGATNGMYFYQGGNDYTLAGAAFQFVQSSSALEMTGTGAQDFVAVKPEINQSGAGAYNALHVIAAEQTTAGGGGSGAQNLISAGTAGADFTSEVTKFRITREGNMDVYGGHRVMTTSDDDAALKVGMIVRVDDDGDDRVKAATADDDMPIGIYNCEQPGCSGASSTSAAINITVGGYTYVLTVEDAADVVRGDIAYVSSTAGLASFSSTLPAAALIYRTIGHSMRSEAKDAFDGAADVDPVENTIANVNSAWAVGDPVVFYDSGDTAPTGMTDGTVYFICSQSSGTVRLSATKPLTTTACTSANSLDITADGSGTTMYLQRLPRCIIHWN